MNESKLKYIEETLSKLSNDIVCESDDNTSYKRPISLYKYRTCNRNNINALKNKQAWFSSPMVWNDKVDCTIFMDLEKFCNDYEKNPQEFKIVIVKEILKIFEKKLAIKIINSDEELVQYLQYYNINGKLTSHSNEKINSKLTTKEKKFFTSFIERMNKMLSSSQFSEMINQMINFNNTIKNNLHMLSLSETYDNNSQWARYADEEKGFCIEYTLIEEKDSEKVIENLLPIIYDEKKEISLIEIFIECLNISINEININESGLIRKIMLSLLTKEKKWSSEEEWRIVLNKKDYPENLRNFDFATAIFLGKDIKQYNKRRLIKIAREQKLKVYQRKLNTTGSSFSIEEIKV